MLYHCAYYLKIIWKPLNVIHYVSFRTICALLTSFALSLLFGPRFIATSQKWFRSKVREKTPINHQTKNDTPTMGGILIIGTTLCSLFLWANLWKKELWIIVVSLLGFSIIGALDDWLKITTNKGVSAGYKWRMQLIFSFIIMVLWYYSCSPNTELCVPFVKSVHPHLGWLIIFWGMFVLLGTMNGVNLADGLDGLAAGPSMFSFSAFAIIAYCAGHPFLARYLYIPYSGAMELSLVCGALIGSLLGFLWYNSYPAQIFMGDSGSLALGATLALIALMCRQEFLLCMTGGLFVFETVSVILQVGSFKLRGKKIFRMAPIHHHYELAGIAEPKITIRCWIVSFILSLISLLLLKLR